MRKGRKRLKVLVKVEVSRRVLALLGLCRFLVLLGAGHDTRLLVVTDALLEEVGLARERDVLHEVEGVGGIVDLVVAESQQQAVGDELNVLAHERGVHAEQGARQSIGEELFLDDDGLGDDVLDEALVGAGLEERKEKACEVGVHALVTRDELVGEGKTRHQATLLEPEDGRERAAEKDTLNSGESDETRRKGGVLVRDPSQSPIGLLLDAGNCDAC
jgi:hypothetical protein